MKKSKTIIVKGSIMEGIELLIERNEKTLNLLLEEGYEIKASNYTVVNNHSRQIYTLLEKEVN